MKKKLSILLLITSSLLFFFSCKDKDDDVQPVEDPITANENCKPLSIVDEEQGFEANFIYDTSGNLSEMRLNSSDVINSTYTYYYENDKVSKMLLSINGIDTVRIDSINYDGNRLTSIHIKSHLNFNGIKIIANSYDNYIYNTTEKLIRKESFSQSPDFRDFTLSQVTEYSYNEEGNIKVEDTYDIVEGERVLASKIQYDYYDFDFDFSKAVITSTDVLALNRTKAVKSFTTTEYENGDIESEVTTTYQYLFEDDAKTKISEVKVSFSDFQEPFIYKFTLECE